jgi:hypothetical protein
MQKKDCKQWFSELNVDMEKIFEIVRQIMYMYEVMKSYDEKEQIKDILSRTAKPRLSNSSSATVSGSSQSSQQQCQQRPANQISSQQ